MILPKSMQTLPVERNLLTESRFAASAMKPMSQDIFTEVHRFTEFSDGNRQSGQASKKWRLDKTGRQWLTQQTIWAVLNWLHVPAPSLTEYNDKAFCNKVEADLGFHSDAKKRYVRMLLAGLTSDWKTMKQLRRSLENKDLVHRIGALDLFSLGFQSDLDQILMSIGGLKADICTADQQEVDVLPVIEQEFIALKKWLDDQAGKGNPDWHTDQVIRLWLIGLTVRALREKTGIDQLIPVSEA